MKTYRVIFQSEDSQFRILEHADEYADIENLKGDCYNPKHMLEMHGPEMTLEELKRQEAEFEFLVNNEGVYGYVLEQWDPRPGYGYQPVDSCWGFVGQYSDSEDRFNHYIVEELKGQIPKLNKAGAK